MCTLYICKPLLIQLVPMDYGLERIAPSLAVSVGIPRWGGLVAIVGKLILLVILGVIFPLCALMGAIVSILGPAGCFFINRRCVALDPVNLGSTEQSFLGRSKTRDILALLRNPELVSSQFINA
jgi:hypothetical protein